MTNTDITNTARKCALCGCSLKSGATVATYKEIAWSAGNRVYVHVKACKGSAVRHPIAPASIAEGFR